MNWKYETRAEYEKALLDMILQDEIDDFDCEEYDALTAEYIKFCEKGSDTED